MIKKIHFILLLLIFVCSTHGMGYEILNSLHLSDKIAEEFMVDNPGLTIKAAFLGSQIEDISRQIASIERERQHSGSENRYSHLSKSEQKEAFNALINELRLKKDNLESSAIKNITGSLDKLEQDTRDNKKRDRLLQELAVTKSIESEARTKENIEKAKIWADKITSKETLLRYGLTAAALMVAYFAAKHAVPKLIDYISGKPKLAQETSLLSINEKVQMWLDGSRPKRKLEDVIFEPDLAAQVKHLCGSFSNTVENNDYFDNVLLYGEPGTGKTLLAQTVALNSHMEYIYFAASSLDQFSLEESLQKLTELFEFAKRNKKKLMIIVDEAEILFANRDKDLSEKSRKLLNHILVYFGTESKNCTIFLITNRPQDLDPAVLSRCGIKLHIGTPAFEQRRDIIKLYINKILVAASQVQPESSILEKAKNMI